MNITNFRDIGGYETADGKRVKKGIFYRSAPITFETESDREEFQDLHIQTILDLRSPQEIELLKDEVPEGCTYMECSAIPLDNEMGGNLDIPALIQNSDSGQLASYLEETYIMLPFQNKAYRILFDLLRERKAPLVFHCSAGKDRTGFAAYLILKTLGVPDETIMYDYMLTNVYRKEENDKLQSAQNLSEAESAMLYVKEEYLQSAIDEIAKKYSDFSTYILEEYGVTEEDVRRFKEWYLE